MKKVRITVLRKEFYPEYADEYLTEGQSVVGKMIRSIVFFACMRLGMNLFLRAARKCRRDFVRGPGLIFTEVSVQCHPVPAINRGRKRMDRQLYAAQMEYAR